MGHMYKSELIRQVARRTRLNQDFVSDVLNAALAEIQGTLAGGDEVVLPGFGTFYTSQRAAGTVKSVRTGEELRYAAHALPAFRAGEPLKQAVRKTKRKKRWPSPFGG